MMSRVESGLSPPKRFLLQFYGGLFVVLGVTLLCDPIARATDAYGVTAGSVRLARARARHAVVGLASYYHPSLDGLLTSSRVPYNEESLTAAHRTLPLGTVVRVMSEDTGKSVKVTINDRGPYVGGRVIDLSKRAARALGIVEDGVAHVRLQVLKLGDNALRL